MVKMPSNFELARRRRGLTQIELCDLAGVSRAIVTLCERHDYVPSALVQTRLADALGAAPETIWPTAQVSA
jgi:DNA-binding XRE family transcriptional regulator